VSFFVVIFSNVTQMLNKDCLYESTFKTQRPEWGGGHLKNRWKTCQINTPNGTYAELQSSLDVSERNDCEGYRLARCDALQFYKQELRFGTIFLSQHL